nr:probable RNA polymerase II nuclear localization protein SLC7A6OS isoform X1 [Crassostrea gigas]
MLKMATIVRVKRKRNAEAVQNILVSCKKAKTDEAGSVAKDDNVCQSYLKFAGTVTSKGEVISKHIRDAIRKEKLQKEYKSHQSVTSVLHRKRQHQKESSKNSRLKITSTLRALDLAELDKENGEVSQTERPSTVQSPAEVCEQCLQNIENKSGALENRVKDEVSEKQRETIICTCKKKKKPNDEDTLDKTLPVASLTNGAQAAEKVYHLYDVEDTESSLPTFQSLLQEAQNASFVTCNSEQMMHEQVQPDRQEDYVYDLYYTNSRDFNLQILESSLSIHSLSADNFEYANNEEEDDEVYEDEDDENEEGNWRNDYPDEDPRFFENEDLDYVYGTGNDDYQAFDYDDRGLAEWMTSGCNIEDKGYDSSSEDTDEENQSTYERFKRRVTKELKINNS